MLSSKVWQELTVGMFNWILLNVLVYFDSHWNECSFYDQIKIENFLVTFKNFLNYLMKLEKNPIS